MREDSLVQEAPHDIEDEATAPVRDKPDGAIDPAGEAGWYLEREREARGEGLEDAGEATGIHPYHIEAIEHGDLTRLPERMDALEMVGAYAHYLGFDPEPLVAHYARFLPPPPVAAKTRHPANPAPLSSAKVLKFGRLPKLPKFTFKLNGVPGGAGGLVASVAGAMLLFAGVSYLLMPGAEVPARQAQIATAVPADEPAEIRISDEPMTDDQQQASAEYAADETAGTGLDGLDELISKNIPATTASIDEAQAVNDMATTAEGREFGAANEASRLTLKAKAPVWIRIEDASGNVVLTQMLNKGDTYKVPDRKGLVVIARDGGLLAYLIDGKEKGILGTPGEILVGRPLDIKDLDKNG